jgi:hypothetical protein
MRRLLLGSALLCLPASATAARLPAHARAALKDASRVIAKMQKRLRKLPGLPASVMAMPGALHAAAEQILTEGAADHPIGVVVTPAGSVEVWQQHPEDVKLGYEVDTERSDGTMIVSELGGRRRTFSYYHARTYGTALNLIEWNKLPSKGAFEAGAPRQARSMHLLGQDRDLTLPDGSSMPEGTWLVLNQPIPLGQPHSARPPERGYLLVGGKKVVRLTPAQKAAYKATVVQY